MWLFFMRDLLYPTVTSVRHWNDKLFSFTTTRDPSFTFETGQFVMIGLEIDGKPLLRAYSVVSANYGEELEFYSIKVPDGALTSRLQHIKVGEKVVMATKATGTLVPGHLLPGKNLYLLATGTGLAPFLSVIQDPFIYDQYEKVILVHGTRWQSELAYQEFIEKELPENEYFGEIVKEKLIYYPTVTREEYIRDGVAHQGRITKLLTTGKLVKDLGMPDLDIENDRFMLCGNNDMLKDIMDILDGWGFTKARHNSQGHYVIERAFIEAS
jgi:ferredoxin--NADP+ reductase